MQMRVIGTEEELENLIKLIEKNYKIYGMPKPSKVDELDLYEMYIDTVE